MRLACRLCLQLGIDDPETWLATAPDRVVNTWAAYWQLEPWGMAWHRHANSMRMLDAIYALCLRWFSSGKSHYEPAEFSDWMPGDWDGAKAKPRTGGSLVAKLDAFVKATSR